MSAQMPGCPFDETTSIIKEFEFFCSCIMDDDHIHAFGTELSSGHGSPHWVMIRLSQGLNVSPNAWMSFQ